MSEREVFSVEDSYGDKLRIMDWVYPNEPGSIGSIDWYRNDDDSDVNSVHLTSDQAVRLGEKLVDWATARRTTTPSRAIRTKVIHIVGSSRFKQFHLGFAQKFTLQGKIVLLAGFFHHADNFPITDDQKRTIDDLCLRKVELADELFVVNPNGYIGASTRMAIVYAKELGKPVEFMDPPIDEDWRNVG